MNVIILHGTKGSVDGNWFQWLKKELESKGHSVSLPSLPTPEGQSVNNWHKALKVQGVRFDKNTIIIGHSCGAAYILHILEMLQESVAKSIFVSGFIVKLGNQEYDSLNESFVNHDFDWKKIVKNAGQITLLHGDDDPYVPVQYALRLADRLKTPLKVIKNGGHLNAEAGYITFPEILEFID